VETNTRGKLKQNSDKHTHGIKKPHYDV